MELIKLWILLKKDLSEIGFDTEFSCAIPTSKLNFIIGKNNSGKSYFLREIIINFETIVESNLEFITIINNGMKKKCISKMFSESFKVESFKSLFEKYKKYLINITELLKSGKFPQPTQSFGFNNNINYTSHTYDPCLVKKNIDILNLLGMKENDSPNKFIDIKIATNNIDYLTILNELFLQEFEQMLNVVSADKLHMFGCLCIGETSDRILNETVKINYIPIFRSLRHPNKLNNELENKEDVFKNRIVDEYKYDENVNVITGLNFYNEYKKALLGTKHQRNKCKDFENFLSKYFFDGKDISIIPNEETFEVKISIDGEDDKFIYNVGDGISSLIIILYELYVNNNPNVNTIYFIEEPENSFHAAYQRMLVHTFVYNVAFKNISFFFTTHSNDLIDLGLNESISNKLFLCKKINDRINVTLQSESRTEIFNELGIKATSVGLVDKVIWVEGKYDALYIRLLLNLKYKLNDTNKIKIEDYDYAFIAYGGSNMKFINFNKNFSIESGEEFITNAESINKKFIIILDDDKMKEGQKKYERFKYLKSILPERVFKLDVREIENLFTNIVLIDFINSNVNDDYKVENDDIDYSKAKNNSLGKYINEILQKKFQVDLCTVTGRKYGFIKDGALFNKQKYYNNVLKILSNNNINYEKDVSIEAKKLINFIETYLD